MWYTLTGNFGNLYPIDYGTNALYKKYHTNSLDIKMKHQNNKKEDYEDEEDDDFYSEHNSLVLR